MKTLLDATFELHDCRYVVTTGTRNTAELAQFCAEPAQEGSSYCSHHHGICHTGSFGKDWQALAGMMDAMEQTIQPVSGFARERPDTAGVDLEIRGGK